MNKEFWRNGLHFSCKQCSACCRFDPGFVFLSEEDLSKLMNWSSMTKECFIDVYCRWVEKPDGYEYLSLKEKKNFDCILWDNGCTAYKYRPFQCSSYPFWNSILSDKLWWVSTASSCPGIGHGRFFPAEQIENVLVKRRNEPLIRRSPI